MKKEQFLTISQLSKLLKVSIDTLRYYDKIDLFKPFFVDSKSGYRYYSIVQYEMLGTILELRDIGLSVESIKDYMDNRNTEKSLSLLKAHAQKLKEEILILETKSSILSERIAHIEKFRHQYRSSDILIKSFAPRFYFDAQRIRLEDDIALSYGILSLENQVNEVLPLIANHRIGHITPLNEQFASDKLTDQESDHVTLFILTDDPVENSDNEIPAGTYLCTTYSGLNKASGTQAVKYLIEFCQQNQIKIVDQRAWNIIQIDTSMTNLTEEAIYEVQIKIEDISD